MNKNQTAIVILAVALFLTCNLLTCFGGLAVGGALGLARQRRWMVPGRPVERDLGRPTPMPQRPRQWPEEVRIGALVLGVTEDSPADDAGIKEGDLILAIDGEPIEADSDLGEWLAEFEPGDRVELTVRRGSREADVQVRLGRRARDSDAPYLGLTYRLVRVPPVLD
jgi:S1-C subfamily serine protease